MKVLAQQASGLRRDQENASAWLEKAAPQKAQAAERVWRDSFATSREQLMPALAVILATEGYNPRPGAETIELPKSEARDRALDRLCTA